MKLFKLTFELEYKQTKKIMILARSVENAIKKAYKMYAEETYILIDIAEVIVPYKQVSM